MRPLFIFDEIDGWEAWSLVSLSRRILASRSVKRLMSLRKSDVGDDMLSPFMLWLITWRWFLGFFGRIKGYVYARDGVCCVYEGRALLFGGMLVMEVVDVFGICWRLGGLM